MYIYKKQYIISSAIALLVMIFTSCAYQFDSEVKAITTKTTYESFEDLNRPIVFTMPMVVKAFRGYKQLGDVFIMDSWNRNDIKIRYYDCSTGELSAFYGVKFGS